MAYQVQLIHEHHIVEICHKGMVDVSEMNLGKNLAFQHLTQLEWKRILLDLEDADFQFETLDVAILFKEIENTFPNRAFIAVLQPAGMIFDYCQYAKSIASAWSNITVEIFLQKDSAMRWLTEQ